MATRVGNPWDSGSSTFSTGNPWDTGGATTTARKKHDNSGWFPDIIANNPVSEAIGHAGDYTGRALRSNPVTATGARFFTGPHQLVDFATHDWIAGLIALGKTATSRHNKFFGPGLFYLPNWQHPIASFEHDIHDPQSLAGLGKGIVTGYNTKYQTSNLIEDLARGKYGQAYKDVRLAGHHEAQDPFGTLLDISVAGKALGAAHLASLERASAAGKLTEGSLRARIAGRVLDEHPREYWIHPTRDSKGNLYEGAKGKLIRKTYRASSTQGRLLQSYMDEMRLHIPEHIPFSLHRLSRNEAMRQVQQVFQRHIYHIQLFADKVNRLPEGLRYAVQYVAELPRDVATIGHDPLGYALDFYRNERDKLANEMGGRVQHPKGKAPKDQLTKEMQLQAVTHKVEVLTEVNKMKDAIYDPANPLHDQFMEAYQAGADANARVLAELVRRGLISQDKVEAQAVLPHRLLRDVQYTPYGGREDVLGNYHAPEGNVVVAPEGEMPVVHHHEATGGSGGVGNREAFLYDTKTGEFHTAGPGHDHASLAKAMGLDTGEVGDAGERYLQIDITPANANYDVPRMWGIGSYATKEQLDKIVPELQQIENLPVATGEVAGSIMGGTDVIRPARVDPSHAFGTTTEEALAMQQAALESHAGIIPAAPSPFGPPVVHRYPLPPDKLYPERSATLIDRRTGEIHIGEPTGPPAAGLDRSAAWHADLADVAGIADLTDLKRHYIQATIGEAVPGLDVPRRWLLPSDVPADKLDKVVHDLQHIENLPVEAGGAEGMIPAQTEAVGEALHNPLAQYGPSWAWPHDAFAVVGAPVGLGGRILDWASKGAPRSRALEAHVRDQGERPGDAWLAGLINSHPEAFNAGLFHRWSQVRSRDYVDEYLYPMSGKLETGYEAGGKLHDESYIIKPRQYTEKPLVGTEVTFDSVGELEKAHPKLKRRTSGENAETIPEWIQRLDQHGLRRIKTKEVTRWSQEIDLSRNLFHKIFHGGLNQIWRYMLLGVKPAWAAANYYTNQALELLKNTGRGGTRAFLYGAKEASSRNIYKLEQYTKRMSLSKQTRYEVNKMLQEVKGPSIGEAAQAFDPTIGAAEFAGSALFNPTPRGARRIPADALTPQGSWLHKLVHHKEYSIRRSLNVLGKPARLVERMNRVGESVVRGQAYNAKVFQTFGKMAHTGEELRKILRENKVTAGGEKAQELLMGRNGPMDVLADYSRMGRHERETIVALVPFYSWYKAILGISAKFFVRDVERVWVLHALATQLAQTASQDMQLGIPVPGFAKDLIPIFGPKGDTQLTMSTRTWNPFQTPVDLARNAEAFATLNPDTSTPNEVGLGLASPLVQGLYSGITGKDPFYGGAYRGWGSGQGGPGIILGSFFYQTPQKRLWDQLTGQYKSKVYQAPSRRAEQGAGIAQYLGLPVKYVNLPNLETRAVEGGAKPSGRTRRRGGGGNPWDG